MKKINWRKLFINMSITSFPKFSMKHLPIKSFRGSIFQGVLYNSPSILWRKYAPLEAILSIMYGPFWLSSSFPFSCRRTTFLRTQSHGLKTLCLIHLSYLYLMSSWYFNTCWIASHLFSSISAKLCSCDWSFRPLWMTCVLVVGIIILVDKTTSDPKARWKGNKLVECLSVIL